MADYQPEMGSEEAAGNADLSGKTAVVTGGSAGLGIETARVLARQGAKVYIRTGLKLRAWGWAAMRRRSQS